MRSSLRRREQPPLSSLFRPVGRPLFTSLPVVLSLVLLPTIAFASPPDPSWIAGFYDGADGDDVVSLVYETSAAHTAAQSHPAPLPCLLGISREGVVHSVPGRDFARRPRSPPVVRSTEFGYVFSSLPPPSSGTEELVALPSIATSRIPAWRLPACRSSEAHFNLRTSGSGPGMPGLKAPMCHHCPSSIHPYEKEERRWPPSARSSS